MENCVIHCKRVTSFWVWKKKSLPQQSRYELKFFSCSCHVHLSSTYLLRSSVKFTVESFCRVLFEYYKKKKNERKTLHNLCRMHFKTLFHLLFPTPHNLFIININDFLWTFICGMRKKISFFFSVVFELLL